MLTITDINLAGLATHYVGNDASGDVLQLATAPVPIEGAALRQALLHYFLSPFAEAPSYNLWHPTDLALNDVAVFVRRIFDDPSSLLLESAHIARHLHDITTLPQIKSGELHVAYFTGCPINGRMTDAVGIYKTESKKAFLRLEEDRGAWRFSPDEGIDPDRMDKGCIIFNTAPEEGYLVHVTDRSAKGGEAQFWKDTFLKVRAADDNYHATEDYLRLCKDFIVEGLPAEYEVERVQQIDLLNKSVAYFKSADQFQKEDFEQSVFGGGDGEVVQSFRRYGEQYAQERDLSFGDTFEISGAALKKGARAMKSVLKLDKNFHVYIHGDRSRIERGYDEGTGLSFYKIFFEEET